MLSVSEATVLMIADLLKLYPTCPRSPTGQHKMYRPFAHMGANEKDHNEICFKCRYCCEGGEDSITTGAHIHVELTTGRVF